VEIAWRPLCRQRGDGVAYGVGLIARGNHGHDARGGRRCGRCRGAAREFAPESAAEELEESQMASVAAAGS
jgi:hypothetical protein